MSKQNATLAAALFSTLILVGCAAVDIEQAEENMMDDIRQAVDQGNEISGHDELLKKLTIPRSRAAAIIVGSGSLANLAGRLGGARLDWICTETSCTCTGDADCNDMFTTVCSDPKTNGVCIESGGQVTCSCQF